MNRVLLPIATLAALIIVLLLYNLYPTGATNTPEFRSDLFKIILEVGLLGLLAVLIKYLAEEYTRKKQHRGEQLSGILHQRLDAYADLWQKTAFCGCRDEPKSLCDDTPKNNDLRCRKQTQKGDVYETLRSWYFTNGHGFYLSHKSKKIYSKIKKLEKSDTQVGLMERNNQLDLLLSQLRSSLKYDCGIYDEVELKKDNDESVEEI